MTAGRKGRRGRGLREKASGRLGRLTSPTSASLGAAGVVLSFVGCRALNFAHPQESLRSCWGCAPFPLRRHPPAPVGRPVDGSSASRPATLLASPASPCTSFRVRHVLVASATSSKLLLPTLLVRSRPVAFSLRAEALTYGDGKRLAVNTAIRSRFVTRG